MPLHNTSTSRSLPLREVINIYFKGEGGGGFELWESCISIETANCGFKIVEDNGALEIYTFIKTSWSYKYQIYKYLMKHRHLSFLRWSWIYFSKKDMLSNIPQQSYLRGFSKYYVYCIIY